MRAGDLEGTHARACAGHAPRDVGDQLHADAGWLVRYAHHVMERGV